MDGLALHDQRAQQSAQGLRMQDAATGINWDVTRQEFGQTDALDEVIDQGQWSQALATKNEALGWRREGLQAGHAGGSSNVRITNVKPPMSRRTEKIVERALQRIAAIREAFGAMELLCSGTLLERMEVCGKPGCRCANDPAARHDP